MKQRRQRYGVTVNVGRETKVLRILAYDREGAIRTAERHARINGWTILGGPEPIRAARRNAGVSVNRWAVDDAALAAAMRELSLTWPVKVRRTTGTRTQGTYRVKGRERCHYITVSHAVSIEQANQAIWHELTHAAQAERTGSPEAWNAFARAQRRYSYRTRPIEVEARANEARAATNPILKAA